VALILNSQEFDLKEYQMTITVQGVIADEIRKATTSAEMEKNAVAAAVAFAKAEKAYMAEIELKAQKE
jgi:hypothetical protein